MNKLLIETRTENKLGAVRSSYKTLVAFVAMYALLGTQLFFAGAVSVAAQDKNTVRQQQQITAQKQKANAAMSQIRSLSTSYNRGTAQVRRLSNQSLDSKLEIERALSTLKRNRKSLDNGPYPMLVNMALNDPTFKRAVEAQGKRMGYEQFYNQLRKNPSMITKIAGASQLQTKIKSELRRQSGYYKTLGSKLRTVQTRLERRKGRALNFVHSNPYVFSLASYTRSVPLEDKTSDEACSATITPIVFGGTEIVFLTPLPIPAAIEAALIAAAVVIIGAAAAAAAVLIKAYVEVKIEDFTDPDDGAGVSDYKKCTDEADAKLEDCLDGISSSLPWWEIAAKEAGCWSIYSLRKADCLLLPQ